MGIVYMNFTYNPRCMVRTLAVVHPTLRTRSSRIMTGPVPNTLHQDPWLVS